MKDTKLEDFIKYAKEVYGLDINIVPSDEPDTFDTFFDSSDLDDLKILMDFTKWLYEEKGWLKELNTFDYWAIDKYNKELQLVNEFLKDREEFKEK